MNKYEGTKFDSVSDDALSIGRALQNWKNSNRNTEIIDITYIGTAVTDTRTRYMICAVIIYKEK